MLIAIGLALTLVSFIPPARTRIERTNALYVEGKAFSFLSSTWVLTPQQVLKVGASADATVTIYLLDKNIGEIYKWISQKVQTSTMDYYEIDRSLAMNVSLFDDFLNEHPSSILMEKEVDTQHKSFEYSPTKVINVTLIVANRNLIPSYMNIHVEIATVIGPSRAILLAQIFTPIGALLVFQWVFYSLKQKNHAKRKE
jgi:hypothetical protein